MTEPDALVTELVDALHEEATREDARRRLLNWDPPPVELLLELLPGQSNSTQVEIARILGGFRDARALPALSALVNDEGIPDSRVRCAALEALRRLESIEAMDVIEEHCSSMDLELRHRAKLAFRDLNRLLQQQLAEDAEREESMDAQPDFDPDLPEFPRPLDLSQLTSERVEVLVDEILAAGQGISRPDLIRKLSKRFGRDYLIRVRKWTNRYVYRQAGLGRLRIKNDLVELP